ncbi:TPA: hypothetical protein ACLXVQ_001552 [Streptococcus pneumoniae]
MTVNVIAAIAKELS